MVVGYDSSNTTDLAVSEEATMKWTPSKLAPFIFLALIAGCDSRERQDSDHGNSQISFQEHSETETGSEPVEAEWFGASTDKYTCLKTGSPADRIRTLQSYGEYVQTKDLADGAVEVGHDTSRGFEYWTFYPSMNTCIAALPASQPISSKYE